MYIYIFIYVYSYLHHLYTRSYKLSFAILKGPKLAMEGSFHRPSHRRRRRFRSWTVATSGTEARAWSGPTWGLEWLKIGFSPWGKPWLKTW